MPNIDLPLEELQKYMGITKKPDDFDVYWKRALAELDNIPLDYTVEKDKFQALGVECLHIYFNGVNNARIHAQFLKPKEIIKKAPALLMFHGYHNSCREFFDKLPFAQSGMVVCALDVRGQAGLSQDNGIINNSTVHGHIVRGIDEESIDSIFYRNVFLDTVQLARIVANMDFVDEKNINVAGFSQGGALALACTALSAIINKSAIASPFLSDYKRVWELELGGLSYDEIRSYFKLRDPLHEREDKFFNKLGYIDVQNLAPMVKNEVRYYTGLMDNICPPSTQFASYNKITAKKTMKVYPDFSHVVLPYMWDDIYSFICIE